MILVTGGAGFIGSVLVSELNKLGREDIIIVDNLHKSSKWMNLRGLKYKEYIHRDELFTIENEVFLQDLTEIYHMGACSATTQMDMDYLMRNNVEYSKELYMLAAELDIPYIYASSAATYGEGEQGYSDDHESIDKLMPLNRYGYSKQLFDRWVLDQEAKPQKWFGIKFFNVYGPNEYHKGEMRSLAHKAFGQIKDKGEVGLFKSYKEGFEHGKQLRDFIYVKDAVNVMIQLMSKGKSEDSGVYNLGTGKAGSFKELVEGIFKALDIPPKIKFIEMPEELRDQYQYYTQAEMSKLRKILPDYKFMNLEEGTADYVKNHLIKDNPYA